MSNQEDFYFLPMKRQLNHRQAENMLVSSSSSFLWQQKREAYLFLWYKWFSPNLYATSTSLTLKYCRFHAFHLGPLHYFLSLFLGRISKSHFSGETIKIRQILINDEFLMNIST